MKGPLAAGLLILAAVGGCRGIATPDWTHPGSADVQQKRALGYDPYPGRERARPVDGKLTRPASRNPPARERPRPLATRQLGRVAEG